LNAWDSEQRAPGAAGQKAFSALAISEPPGILRTFQKNATHAATAAATPMPVANGMGSLKPMVELAINVVTTAVMKTAGSDAIQWDLPMSAR
jgi:hypothetical protein